MSELDLIGRLDTEIARLKAGLAEAERVLRAIRDEKTIWAKFLKEKARAFLDRKKGGENSE